MISPSAELRSLVEVDDWREEVRIQRLDPDSARRIFHNLSQHTYGVATTFPGSTIASADLGIAADSGSIQATRSFRSSQSPRRRD